jgi:putative membrane protein
MFVNRWYVMALVITFMVVAVAERGWLRMMIWLVVGTFIGWLSEFCSTRTGFPFTFYDYYPSSFPNELWLSNIPLFASLSFASLTYLGHSLTYTLFSPLKRSAYGIERVESKALSNSLKVALWSSLLISWSDFAIDPVTHLGQYWFLGKIYMYVKGDYGWLTPIYSHLTPAWHFDIPIGNYVGWLITCFTIVFVNQQIDRVLVSNGIGDKPVLNFSNRCLMSLGYFIGNFIFVLCVNLYLFFKPEIPVEKHIGLVLANTVGFIVVFVVFNVVVFQKKLRSI